MCVGLCLHTCVWFTDLNSMEKEAYVCQCVSCVRVCVSECVCVCVCVCVCAEACPAHRGGRVLATSIGNIAVKQSRVS